MGDICRIRSIQIATVQETARATVVERWTILKLKRLTLNWPKIYLTIYPEAHYPRHWRCEHAFSQGSQEFAINYEQSLFTLSDNDFPCWQGRKLLRGEKYQRGRDIENIKYYTLGPKIWIWFSNVRYCIWHEKIKLIPSSHRASLPLLYRHGILPDGLQGFGFCQATRIDLLYNNFVIQSKVKPNKLWQAPIKRSQYFNTVYRNIDVRNMMHSFGHTVATCCNMLGLLAQIWKWSDFSWTSVDVAWCCDRLARFVQQCCARACTLVCFSIPNISQHVATGWPNARTRNMLRQTMQRYVVLKCCDHLAGAYKCWASNVGVCCLDMLQSLGRVLSPS